MQTQLVHFLSRCSSCESKMDLYAAVTSKPLKIPPNIVHFLCVSLQLLFETYRVPFQSRFFATLEHNIYSSVCRASFFLAHLLLLSENITPPPPMLRSFRGFK